MGGNQHVEQRVADREDDPQRHALAVASPHLVGGLAIEQLHDDERGAVLRDVVVEYGDGPGMFDRVGDVAFA